GWKRRPRYDAGGLLAGRSSGQDSPGKSPAAGRGAAGSAIRACGTRWTRWGQAKCRDMGCDRSGSCRAIEHVLQKWEPVLRKRTCSNKELAREVGLEVRSSIAGSNGDA